MTSSSDAASPSGRNLPPPSDENPTLSALPHELVPAGRDQTALDASPLDEGIHTFRRHEILADRYVIVRFIARGGMGEVYEAVDTELDRSVAVKTIRSELAEDEGMMARFRREIVLNHRVTHRNVSRIFDLGHHLRVDPSGREEVIRKAKILAKLGRTDQARLMLASIDLTELGRTMPAMVGATYLALGEDDEARRWFERSLSIRETYMAMLLTHGPDSDALRARPWFDDLLQRTGLPRR